MRRHDLLRRRVRSLVVVLLLLAGCSTGINYPAPDSPRHAGGDIRVPPRGSGDTLRIVSFNVAYASEIDSAIAVLKTEPELEDADVVLLQEMDAPGTRRIAEALGLAWVFYPASWRYQTERDFGNAVLSRWPIIDDAKLVLPHDAAIVGTQRTATAATIRVDAADVRVYSAHLGTVVNITSGQREEQLRRILMDAAAYERVIIGGDMNHPGVGEVALESGYWWPTRRGPRTGTVGRLDHIFIRGMAVSPRTAGGTVLNVRDASDHRPVWALAILR